MIRGEIEPFCDVELSTMSPAGASAEVGLLAAADLVAGTLAALVSDSALAQATWNPRQGGVVAPAYTRLI